MLRIEEKESPGEEERRERGGKEKKKIESVEWRFENEKFRGSRKITKCDHFRVEIN